MVAAALGERRRESRARPAAHVSPPVVTTRLTTLSVRAQALGRGSR